MLRLPSVSFRHSQSPLFINHYRSYLKGYNFSLFPSNSSTHSLLWYFTLETVHFSHWTHFHFGHFVNEAIFTQLVNFNLLTLCLVEDYYFNLNRRVCCTLWKFQTFLKSLLFWFHTKVKQPKIVCSHHPVLMTERSCD